MGHLPRGRSRRYNGDQFAEPWACIGLETIEADGRTGARVPHQSRSRRQHRDCCEPGAEQACPQYRGANIAAAAHASSALRRSQAACRSEEHTSELQSLMRISYAVFCLKKKKHYSTIYPNLISILLFYL